jgi:hypothetical protein
MVGPRVPGRLVEAELALVEGLKCLRPFGRGGPLGVRCGRAGKEESQGRAWGGKASVGVVEE